MQYCSLQHWTLLPSPVTSTVGCCFCFGSVSSFFLELFLHWSQVAYWAPTDLGSSYFSVLYFCLFILFMGFSRKEYWGIGLLFPYPVDHVFQSPEERLIGSWAKQVKGLLFIRLAVSDSLWPHGLHHSRFPCPSPSPEALSNSCPLSWWCHPTISVSVISFSYCLQSSQHQGLFHWVDSWHQVAKVLELLFQHQSFQWILKIDFP